MTWCGYITTPDDAFHCGMLTTIETILFVMKNHTIKSHQLTVTLVIQEVTHPNKDRKYYCVCVWDKETKHSPSQKCNPQVGLKYWVKHIALKTTLKMLSVPET